MFFPTHVSMGTCEAEIFAPQWLNVTASMPRSAVEIIQKTYKPKTNDQVNNIKSIDHAWIFDNNHQLLLLSILSLAKL